LDVDETEAIQRDAANPDERIPGNFFFISLIKDYFLILRSNKRQNGRGSR